jgi:hypothetical protein
VVAGLFSVLTAGAVFWALKSPYGRPQDTFDRCMARYSAGTLTNDEGAFRCGQDTLRSAIRSSGRARYDEIDAIYDRAEERGKARVRDAMAAAYKAGRAVFSSLPNDEQNRIKAASKRAFVYARGFSELSSDERALVGDPSALLDATKRDALIRALGEKAISGAAPNAATPHRNGTQVLATITAKVTLAGNAAFRALARDDREAIEERSYYEHIAREGLARLDDADKAVIGDVTVLTDLAARTARIPVVGRGLLSEADRAKLPNKTHEQFAAAGDTFIDTEGRRIIGARLATSFKGSRPSLEIERYSGTVIAWSGAMAAVRWSGAIPPDAADLLGSNARFRRNGNVWTMDWR